MSYQEQMSSASFDSPVRASVSGINIAYESVSATAERLDKAVQIFLERISPVLKPDNSPTKEEFQNKAYSSDEFSDVATKFLAISNHISRIAERVELTADRIDL